MVKRSLPGQRVGAKAWVDFFTEYLAEELNYSGFRVDGAICKGWFGRTPIILIHVDDLIFTGDSKYTNEIRRIHEIFPPKIQDRFDTSVSSAS